MTITTNVWNVNADGDWDTAADWSQGTVPDSNNNVTISTTSIHTITHNSGADTLNNLYVGDDHFVMNGGSLTFDDGASFGLDYQQYGGTISGTDAVYISGAGDLLGGVAQGSLTFLIGGTTQIGNYTLGGSDTFSNSATTNQTAQITLGDATGVNVEIVNASSGTYTINGDYGVTQGAASASIYNGGTFEKTSGSGTSLVGVSIADTGTISVTSGILQFNGPSNSFSGTISGAGQFAIGGGVSTIASGATITASTFGVYDNGTSVTLNGNLSYGNSFVMAEASAINLNSYTLTLSGPASFYSSFGTPTVNGGGTLATSGATSANVFTLGGTVNWVNSGVVTQNGQNQIGDGGASAATFTNQAAGQFNIANDTSLERGSAATSSFVNAGTFAKTAGGGTSYVDVNVVDTGTVSVASGTLYFRSPNNSFAGTISGAGQFVLGGGSVDAIASGTSISVSSFDIYDNGTTVTLGGNLAYANSFTMAEASAVNLNGHTLTLSGPTTFNASFGTPLIGGSGTLATSGATTSNVFTLGGTVNWSNTGVVTQVGQTTIGDGSANAAKFTNQAAGQFNIANDSSLERGAAATSSFVNAGTLAKTAGSGTSYVDVNVVDTGTISVASGTLYFRSPNNSFAGTISGAGQFALGGASVDTIATGTSLKVGSFGVYDNGTTVTLGGNLTYANSFLMQEGSVINLNGHALTLSGTAAFIANFGTPTVNGSGALATSGATTVSVFTLGGSVNWSNTGTITEIATLQIGDGGSSNAMLTNAAAGHYNIADDSGITRGAAAGSSINNVGAFAKTAGTGKSVVSVNFNNSGTVEVMTGALELAAGVTGAGTMKIDAGATLEMGSTVSAGAYNFTASTGTLQVDSLAGFGGSVTGFVAGDVFDLAGQAVASMTYTGTKLTVKLTNNTTKTVNFASTLTALQAVSDGAGGTDIIALPTPYALTTGADIFAFASGTNNVTGTAATLNASDTLTGGTGVDTLALSGGGTMNLAALAAFSFDDVTLAAGANYTVTAGNTDVGAGQLSISAAALTAANSANINVSAATTGKFLLTGGSGADTLVGGGTSDYFYGRGGNDTFTGGSVANTYVFSTALNAATNDPTVTNFNVSSDNINLAHQVFTALTAGALPAADFTIGTGATTSSQHIIYNSGTGALLYDSDGSGSAAAVQFAALSTGLSLTAANFKVT